MSAQRILIIDDDPEILRRLGLQFEAAGDEVEVALDGHMGLQVLPAFRPQVVLTDIIMPNREGLETILDIRRVAPDVGIIAMSGGGGLDAGSCLALARTLGADAVIAKPFRFSQLQKLVAEVLARTRRLAGGSGDERPSPAHAPDVPASLPRDRLGGGTGASRHINGSQPVADILHAVLSALDGVAYVVEPQGLVVDAAPELGVGAHSGDMAGPVQPLVGSDLFASIQGEDVRAAYRRLTERILSEAQGAVSFEYRCDAPDVRRQMRLSISRLDLPDHPPLVLYQSLILSAVQRPWMTLFEPERILDHVRAESGLPIIRVCSICQKVSWPPSEAASAGWLEADAYYRRGGPADVRTSHGLCSPCAAHLETL